MAEMVFGNLFMKRFTIFYLLLAIGSALQAASEINAFASGVTTAYSVVRESEEIIDRLKRVAPYP